jgi:hypothetical protein
VLPLSRHVTAPEHGALGDYAASLACARVVGNFPKVHEAWRFVELPSAQPGHAFHSSTHWGVVLDVGDALAIGAGTGARMAQ